MRFALAVVLLAATTVQAESPRLDLIKVQKIWDKSPHNAFTDLVFDGKQWFCTFREGTKHVSPDGALRVLTSSDVEKWESAALVTSPIADLRDPKLSIGPDHRLVLTGGAALHKPSGHTHESFIWTSKDGRDWGQPTRVAGDDQWLWRLTWNGPTAYGVSYSTNKKPAAQLHRGDGKTFVPVGGPFKIIGEANEAALVFEPDGSALCLIRRDGEPGSGLLGSAKPPFTDWTWREVGARIGGPQMIRLPDSRLIAAVRLYDGKQRTSICWIDRATGKLAEALALPSGGDTSYAGMVWHDGRLWVSYYSSHEGKTAIYLAQVRVPD